MKRLKSNGRINELHPENLGQAITIGSFYSGDAGFEYWPEHRLVTAGIAPEIILQAQAFQRSLSYEQVRSVTKD
jgi:hypothetical protein